MALVIISAALLMLADFLPSLRQRDLRGALTFLIVFVPAIFFALMLAMKIELPSVILLLRQAFKALGIIHGPP